MKCKQDWNKLKEDEYNTSLILLLITVFGILFRKDFLEISCDISLLEKQCKKQSQVGNFWQISQKISQLAFACLKATNNKTLEQWLRSV